MGKILKKVNLIILIVIQIILIASCGPKNGLIRENGNTFFYANGEMQVGWQKINNKWHFFYQTDHDSTGEYKIIGSMKRDEWLYYNANYYYFDKNGKMLVDGIYTLKDSNSYGFDSEGKLYVNLRKEINGQMYQFDNNGVARKVPDKEVIINCVFPKKIRSMEYGEVIIENMTAWINADMLYVDWEGVAGASYRGNSIGYRYIGIKVYDPDGIAVCSETFRTIELKQGEKFVQNSRALFSQYPRKKGIYRVDLYNTN